MAEERRQRGLEEKGWQQVSVYTYTVRRQGTGQDEVTTEVSQYERQ